MLQCPQRDDKYKGHILRALKKKYHLAPKGVHGAQRVNIQSCLMLKLDGVGVVLNRVY
jgi:hypothetical protein